MPEPTRDPIQRLESFGTGGLSVTPLDAAQVRRLGDQRRTRRTATIGVAASVIAVVGLVVPVTLVVAGDDEPPRPPATQTPSPTPTPTPSAPPLGLGDIPEDFPLDVDAPDLSGDGGEKRGPDPSVETAGLTLCGKDAIREATTKGRLGFSTTGPEFVENRELRTFASEGAATTVMNALQEDLNGCTSWTEPEADHTVTPIVADTGQDSITYSDTVVPLGGTVYQITRVGSAILTIAQSGEYSVETAQVAGTGALAKITRKITPEMCLFTAAGCGSTIPKPTDAVAPGLLAHTDLPGNSSAWETVSTGPAGAEPFGVCARRSLQALGATAVIERTFRWTPDETSTAAQQVAQFRDQAAATYAWEVLLAWRTTCTHQTVDSVKPRVFDLNVEDVGRDNSARWYSIGWETGTSGTASAQGNWEDVGIAASGRFVTVVLLGDRDAPMDNQPGPDGTYSIQGLVRTASSKLLSLAFPRLE